MTKNNDNTVIKVINSVTGDSAYILKSKLDEYEHKTDKDGNIIVIPKTKPNLSQNENSCAPGCFLIFAVLFTVSLVAGCGFIVQKEYKANKRHPNIISYIGEQDKTLIISDTNNKEERLIKYDGYKDKFAKENKLPEFEEQVKKSKVGDTVMFVSPNYDTRRKFVLDTQNRLYLNKDSIISRIKAEKQR